MRLPAAIQRAIQRRLLAWPPPDDADFAGLTAVAKDVAEPEVLDFYGDWLPRATDVPAAEVRAQQNERTHTQDVTVWLNVSQASSFGTPKTRLAYVHATMWHEAGHVRHAVHGRWLLDIAEVDRELGARCFAAFQLLEDLRVERELVAVRPQAVPWLRYQLGCHGGAIHLASRAGAREDCGWAMASTLFAGHGITGVLDSDAIRRLNRTDRRFAKSTADLWDLWESYSTLSDADLDNGEGVSQIMTLARLLPQADPALKTQGDDDL